MRARRALVGLVAIAALACESAPAVTTTRDAGAPRDSATADAGATDATIELDAGARSDAGPLRDITPAPSDAVFANPERGFYRYTEIETARDLAYVRAGGDTLVYSYVRLDAYRDGAIAPALLTRVQAGLDAARAAGVKVILRFAYNEGPYPDSEPDASLARVLAHITEVTPLLRANEDVIALVQAGFIGAWGEWHTSTNGLDDDPDARRQIVEALLRAIPASRSTQLRYPLHKEALYGEPLTAAEAFGATDEARVGHHNDCFVSSDTDVGTYPDREVARWTAYVAADTRWAPMGGETCAVFPARSACGFAPGEMERLHFTYINRDYHPAVVASWTSGGCMADIERGLGYRFVITRAALSDPRGDGTRALHLEITNEGWAAPMNPRAAYLVVGSGVTRDEIEIASDVRRWGPGETVVIERDVGGGPLALWLPDAARSLRDRPEYAIRLANEGVWDAASGENRIAP